MACGPGSALPTSATATPPGAIRPTDPGGASATRNRSSAPSPDDLHPLKAQGFESAVINLCMGDGSVLTINSSIDDFNFFTANTPADGDIPTDSQIP